MTCFPPFHAFAQHSSVSEELELLTNVYFDELDISYSERLAQTLAYVLYTCGYLLHVAASSHQFSLSIHPPCSSPSSLLLSSHLTPPLFLLPSSSSSPNSGDAVLKYHLTPSTADDKDKQFVYLDLTITLSAMVNIMLHQ